MARALTIVRACVLGFAILIGFNRRVSVRGAVHSMGGGDTRGHDGSFSQARGAGKMGPISREVLDSPGLDPRPALRSQAGPLLSRRGLLRGLLGAAGAAMAGGLLVPERKLWALGGFITNTKPIVVHPHMTHAAMRGLVFKVPAHLLDGPIITGFVRPSPPALFVHVVAPGDVIRRVTIDGVECEEVR